MTTNEIFGWFNDNHKEALTELIKKHQVKTVIEIGSFLGKSTAFIAKQVDKVVCIDPFVFWEDKDRPNGDVAAYGGEDFFDKFWANMTTEGVSQKLEIHRGTSVDSLAVVTNLNPNGVDLVYIDGLHDYESVLQDIKLYHSQANKVICGDDYDENWPGVVKAVNEYYEDDVKHNGNFWYVIK